MRRALGTHRRAFEAPQTGVRSRRRLAGGCAPGVAGAALGLTLLLATLAVTGACAAARYTSTDTPKDDRWGEVISTIYVPSGLTVADVNVSVDICRCNSGDLAIWLLSPQGTEIMLRSSDDGPWGLDGRWTYNDEGYLRPVEPLSLFDGENAKGKWMICLQDLYYDFDPYEYHMYYLKLNEWRLTLNSTGEVYTWRPDGLIHNGSTYLGNNIYGTKGEGQTHQQTVKPRATATYEIRLCNDGDAEDVFLITGSGANWKSGWWVEYERDWNSKFGQRIEEEGCLSPPLAPGASCSLRMRVTPLSTAKGNTTFSTYVTATSLGSGTRKDVVKAQTTCAPVHRVDGLILDEQTWVGDEIVNATGAWQSTGKSVGNGAEARYDAVFYNEGNAADAMRIAGPAGNDMWTIRYQEYWSRTDVTSDVTGAGWTSPVMVAGRGARIRILVTPAASVTGGASRSVLLLAASVQDPTKRDAVKATTTCAARFQPDGAIYRGSTWLGEGVISTRAANQTVMSQVTLGHSAAFYPRFVNAGNKAERLRLTGTAGNSRWTVRYQEYWSDEDITAAVTGKGWLTPVLGPGGECRLRVAVTPKSTAKVSETFRLLLSGASTTVPARTDTVGMVTSRK